MRHHVSCLSILVVAIMLCFCFASRVVGQTVTGTVQGTVTDLSGAVVPGVEVVLHNVETGQERTLTTNSEGFYIASFVPLGRYTVSAQQKGFVKLVQENVEVTLNQTRVVDFTLKPAGVSEAVLVTS